MVVLVLENCDMADRPSAVEFFELSYLFSLGRDVADPFGLKDG